MTKKDKLRLTQRLRLELQAKIGPLLDVLYSVVVVLIGFHILIPHLPNPVRLLLTILLLLSGLTLRGANKGLITRRSIVGLLKALLQTLDRQ